jgi:hypothetical protein
MDAVSGLAGGCDACDRHAQFVEPEAMSTLPGDLRILCHLREDVAARTHYGRSVVAQTTAGEAFAGRVESDG